MNRHSPFEVPCIVDQKDLNEAAITAIAEVAQRNPHHCAELFGIPLKIAERFVRMAKQASRSKDGQLDNLLDLATTPAPLWRLNMSVHDMAQMQQHTIPMVQFYLEPYRSIIAKLNEQVILTLMRYGNRPSNAVLVGGIGNPQLLAAMAQVSCSTLLRSAHNLGRPLVTLTINEVYLDRIFDPLRPQPIHAALRGLMARVSCTWENFSTLTRSIDQEAAQVTPDRERKIGRPTAIFLPEGEAQTITELVTHRVPTKTILAFTRSEINPAQVRKLRMAVHANESLSNENSRFQDTNLAVWGNATRRLIVTAVFAHQRMLMSLGLHAHAAFVEAYAHYNTYYKDEINHLSLGRMISAVYMPMREGLVQLGYCGVCTSMHLLHETHQNGVECPVCALLKFNKLARHCAAKSEVSCRPSSARKAKRRVLEIDSVEHAALFSQPSSRSLPASVDPSAVSDVLASAVLWKTPLPRAKPGYRQAVRS
jgi:hypothetical protein